MAFRRTTDSCLALAATIFLTACTGCLPYYGLGKRRVPRDPIAFIDSTGQPVTPVLVIGRYTAGSGITTGGGDGPGATREKVYIAHPFV
jgi:hypothetical protein